MEIASPNAETQPIPNPSKRALSIHLAVKHYVRFPRSLWNVEDLLHERRIKISHITLKPHAI